MSRNNIYQTFKTNASMRAGIGITTNPPVANVFYYCSETNKQGYWYWAEGASEADNEGTVIVTTTGSHRLKRVFFFGNSHVFKNWFTGSNSYFDSVADANATLTSAYRLVGMRVFILEDVMTEYWYRDGAADEDLVPVAEELFVDNGDDSGGAVQILSAPDEDTIKAVSFLFNGLNGITVDAAIVGDVFNIDIDGGGAVQFLSGDYEDMPSPTTPGITYYSNNQLFGRYLSTGTIWEYVPGTNILVYEQWLANVPAFYSQQVANGGTSFIDTSTLGRWRNDTQTATNGSAGVVLSQSMASSFSGIRRVGMYVERVELSALSDGTNRYVARIGRAAGADVNGVWFEYSDNVNSGKWLCVSCNSGVRQTSDSGITVAASGTQYTMCWVYDLSGTDTVYFYINGVQVGSAHTTTVPANFTSAYPFSISIEKSAGTSNRGLMFGRVLIPCEFTTGI